VQTNKKQQTRLRLFEDT